MFDLKDFPELLITELAARMAKHGFELKPREQGFRASRPGGNAMFHLSFIPHTHDFDVVADVSIRVDVVEDLLNEGRTYLSKGEKKLTSTIGTELGNLSEGKQRRWTIASEADVKRVADLIHDAFRSIAMPYIEKYSGMDNMFKILSSNERSAWLHSPAHGARCKSALALAYVLRRSHDIEDLIARSEGYLGSLNFLNSKREFEDFQQFATRIRQLMEGQRLGRASAG
jgi:hypothetical protein